MIISLYGEIQRQVIAERLRCEHGIDAIFTEPTPAYAEQVIGTGEAISPMGRFGFAAGVGFRIEPAPIDAPLRCERTVEHGILPRAFFTAITETVPRALRQGRLGWPVIGCRVMIIATDYDSVGSTGGDFRHLVPLVLAEALDRAGTRVCEPYSTGGGGPARRHGRPGAGPARPARGRPSRSLGSAPTGTPPSRRCCRPVTSPGWRPASTD